MAAARTSAGLVAVAAAALAVPAVAAAEPSFIFTQAASQATASDRSGRAATLTLATGRHPLVAVEERPGRRTGTMPRRSFAGLWQRAGTFRSDAPNAVLTGRDPQGRNRRAIVTITGASATATGMRYRVRTLRGRVPARLAPANLTIDGVSAAALAYIAGNDARVDDYEPVINALMFPSVQAPIAAPSITVPSGQVLSIGSPGGAPSTVLASSITIQPNAELTLVGDAIVSAATLVMQPGARIVATGSPTMVALSTSQCGGPFAVEVTGALTEVEQPGGARGSSYWPVTSARSAGCTVSWSYARAPAPRSGTNALGPYSVTSTTQVTIATVPGMGMTFVNPRLTVD